MDFSSGKDGVSPLHLWSKDFFFQSLGKKEGNEAKGSY